MNNSATHPFNPWLNYGAFIALGVIWGSNFIFMKWASELITPLQTSLLRILFGFIPLCVLAIISKKMSWSHLRYTHHFIVMALIATALYYTAYAYGSKVLPSGIAGLLSGSIPLFSFLCAWAFLKSEKIGAWSCIGLLLGLAGVVCVAKPWTLSQGVELDGHYSLLGIFAMLTGSCMVGLSFVYAKRYIVPLQIPNIVLVTYQLAIAVVLLALVTPFEGISAVFTDYKASVSLILGLGLLGTGGAYLLYYHLINVFGALKGSSVTYLPPIVALFIGFFFIGETLTAFDLIGSTSIVLSLYAFHKQSGT